MLYLCETGCAQPVFKQGSQQPEDRLLLVDALHHRLAEVDKRRLTVDLTDADDADSEQARVRSASVETLLKAASKAVEDFGNEFRQTWDLRKKTMKVLGRYTEKHNICFDGMKRVSHVITSKSRSSISMLSSEERRSRGRAGTWRKIRSINSPRLGLPGKSGP